MTEGARTRLIITDDHPMVVEGLRSMLQHRYDVVAVAHSGKDLLKVLRKVRADCLLLDLSMPERNGLELLPDIRAIRPSLKVLVVTMHLEKTLAVAALDAGANGFIPKDSGMAELEEAIEAVLAGERYLSPRVPSSTNRVALGAIHPALSRLTPRQHEILQLLADGKTSEQIGAILGLSYTTVTYHRVNIRKMLGVETDIGLMRYALLVKGTPAPPPLHHGRHPPRA